jgi:signal transduction histidine kinase/CheY-like chemotaxis protein
VSAVFDTTSERALILAPQGRDAHVAAGILLEGGVVAEVCNDLRTLTEGIMDGAGLAVLTDDAMRSADIKSLAAWVKSQPPWSDFPFILLTQRGAGLERNPAALRDLGLLGNVIFLERPFHPTTFLSSVRTALRGRMRQYEARARLEALHESEANARSAQVKLRHLNETLEARVEERTAELAASNRQLVAQIEERQRVEATLRQMQRLEAIGQLTSGVAHDFNNLLTVVLGNIAFLEKTGSFSNDPKLQQRLSHMRLAAERGAKLTSQLLAFSRRQHLEPKPLDVNESLVNMHGLLQSTLGGGITINVQFRQGIWPAFVDPDQLELAVLNLVINARDAMNNEGTVTITTSNAKVETTPEQPEEPVPGDYITIGVSDTGSGMTKEVLAKAFEPFFTTKEIGKGSGLGLSQVLGFAKQSGGGIRIDTRVGEGTSIKVYLPRAAENSVLEGSPFIADSYVIERRGAVILLVDDDSAVRQVTASILEEIGYVMLTMGSGGAALDALDHTKVDLVLLDFAMPGMSGVELARQIQQKFPALPILFVTGYADKAAFADVNEERIIKKPFIGNELTTKVNAALIKAAPHFTDRVVVPLRR